MPRQIIAFFSRRFPAQRMDRCRPGRPVKSKSWAPQTIWYFAAFIGGAPPKICPVLTNHQDGRETFGRPETWVLFVVRTTETTERYGKLALETQQGHLQRQSASKLMASFQGLRPDPRHSCLRCVERIHMLHHATMDAP